MPKNVLMVTLDDLNVWATLKDYYPGLVDTPNLDALMQRGTTFDNAFAQTAICNPSRTSLLTGKLPTETGVLDNTIDWNTTVPLSETLHKVMRDAGYYTGGTGKVYHTPTLPTGVQTELFDQYATSTLNWTGSDLQFRAGAGSFTENEHGDYINATWASDFINAHAGETTPWFLSYGLYRPHVDWVVPPEYFNPYPLEDVLLPIIQASDNGDVPAFMKARINAFHQSVLDANYWAKMVQAYLASISFADAMLGRVLDALANSVDANDTAIVVFGDNGYHFGEKDIWHKFTLWDEAARVPLIIVDPDVPAGPAPDGWRVTKPVELLDIFPTILDLAGAGTRPWLDGQSLTPLLGNPNGATDGMAITLMYGSVLIAAEVDDVEYRYIRYADGSGELYNIDIDVHQHTNLWSSSDPLYVAAKAALAVMLASYAPDHHLFLSEVNGDNLSGTSGRDLLVGGHDQVTLSGGDSDDTYDVYDSDVVITEAPGGGTDLVHAHVNYTLPDNLENVVVAERAGRKEVSGNTLDNKMYGIAVPDTLRGAAGNDSIEGLDGNDSLFGDAGNDTLLGGAGADALVGDTGDDSLNGMSDADQLFDGTGEDTFAGGSGLDLFIMAVDGDDLDVILDFKANEGDRVDITAFDSDPEVVFSSGILSVNGQDVVDIRGDFNPALHLIKAGVSGETWVGTEGADTHSGTAFNDSLEGLAGNDTIDGSGGDDTIKGGADDDSIGGGDGGDLLNGNAGNDIVADGTGLDTFNGGPGADTFVLTANDASTDVINDFVAADGDRVDITAFGVNPTVLFAGGLLSVNGETVADISGDFDPALHLIKIVGWNGTDGPDSHTGTGVSELIDGLAGNDSLDGSGGDDSVLGGAGRDSLSGGDGNDVIDGGLGRDAMFGHSGNDLLFASESRDTLAGGTGDDLYVLPKGGKILENAGEGIDTVFCASSHTLALYVENAVCTGTRSNSVKGNALDNFITGSEVRDRQSGLLGNDSLTGGGGNDSLSGGDGNDSLSGGAGNDSLSGGKGADTLFGDAGRDSLDAGRRDGAVDIFQYETITDSGVGRTARDSIKNFELGIDKIDLGFGGFEYIGAAAFTATSTAQLRFQAKLGLQADFNGDGFVDMEIGLSLKLADPNAFETDLILS